MKKVRVEDSVGMVLAHDLTRIIPGEFKGAAFKKGYIIRQEDVEVLKDMGKYHIYMLDMGPGQIHENEAAIRLGQAASGIGIKLTEPEEGKVNFKAVYNGLLKIRTDLLHQINMIEHISLATLHDNTLVQAEQVVAGTRIIPLVTDRTHIEEVESVCAGRDLVSIKPFRKMKAGIVICGNEVYTGRLQDRFAPVFEEKLQHYGVELAGLRYAPDEAEFITGTVLELINAGADCIITAGGMSVDPDDVTPEGIRNTGAEVISYGAPVLPGAMFMMAYLGDIPILGVPACGMYHKTTVFDLVFARVLAGERIEKKEIAALGYGGLCTNCKPCRYPYCSFGKA